MSKKKKIILTVVCIALLVLIVIGVIGAAVLYKMSITTEGCWGPGDFPMPDNSIRIICERIVTYYT